MSEPDDRSSGPRALLPPDAPNSARHGQQHRRTVLTGVGSAGVAVLLIGCQTYEEPTPSGLPAASGTTYPDVTAPAHTNSAVDRLTDGARDALATVADIPVGGGKVFAAQGVVLTQATAGDIRGFSARCTHQGCTVTSVENARIVCACHNSTFDITDGSVRTGPAKRPLPKVAIEVDGENIYLA